MDCLYIMMITLLPLWATNTTLLYVLSLIGIQPPGWLRSKLIVDYIRNSGPFSDPLGVLINISWVDFPRPPKKHILGTHWKDPCKDLSSQILIVTVITLYNHFRWTGLEFLHISVFRDSFEPKIVFHVIKCLTSCLQVFFSIVRSATLGTLERGSWE